MGAAARLEQAPLPRPRREGWSLTLGDEARARAGRPRLIRLEIVRELDLRKRASGKSLEFPLP